MSVLNDKIQSFSPEANIEFDQAYTTSPTNTGSSTLAVWALAGTAPTFISSDGPLGGSGYWNAPAATRFRQIGPNYLPTFSDGNYVVGMWFRFPTLPTGTSASASTILAILPTNGSVGFNLVVSGSSATTNASRLGLVTSTTAIVPVGPTLQANRWYYVAFSRGEDGTSINRLYLDGTSIYTITHSTVATATSLSIGSSTASASVVPMHFSNLHTGTTANFNASAIAEIWTAGSSAGQDAINNETPATATALSVLPSISISINNVELPATATALQTEPTIAVETGDHTQITTSIPVSALMAPATVSTQSFINITVPDLMEATVELINNIIVGSSNSVNFGAQEFFASATLVKPFLAESAMFASAQMGNHTVYVDPNYQNLITSIGPYLYIHDGSPTPINKGYQSGTFTVSSALLKNQVPPPPMSLSGEGLAWRSTNNTGQDSSIRFNAPSNETSFDAILSTGEWAVESWISTPDFATAYRAITDSSLIVTLGNGSLSNGFTGGWDGISVTIKNGPSTQEGQSVLFPIRGSGIDRNAVYHLVVTSTMISSTNQLIRVWLNTSLVFSRTFTKTAWTASKSTFFVIDSDGSELYHDEIALYNRSLTNSEIISHYNFMSALSPNASINAEEATADIEIVGGNIVVVGNATPEIKEATATALIVAPTIIAGRSFTHNANIFAASSAIIQPGISTGNTVTATPNIAFAEAAAAFRLNTTYFEYVQANIAPYRYVTFDGATPTIDFGTDNDYAVQPTIIGGTVVNPDEGINGRSAKTAGLSYITDGVILKESEFDDDWGVSTNTYHSSFWIQEAPEDNSTGLRVLWNLNSHLDNQHIILYQYQNKLTMSFSDNSGNFINQTTVSDINLFNGQRHFVVIYVDHTGVNDRAYLYVDSVLRMTVELGSYRVEMANGTTFVGPNDEANNHPRLAVGCLITPFGQTSLPVVPTNTRLYIDEIVWAKTAINQAQVTALYNVMPDKDNSDYIADAMTASALSVNPAVSTNANYLSQPATASALINEVTIIADRNIVVVVDPATASAEFLGAQRINNVIFASDVMVANAIFNSAGVRITISGGPMLATVTLNNRLGSGFGFGIKVNGRNINYVLSPWAAWLRSTQIDSILTMREVK